MDEPNIFGLQENLPNQYSYLDNKLQNYHHIDLVGEGFEKEYV